MAEVQVNEGNEETYLWPTREIFEKAVENAVKRVVVESIKQLNIEEQILKVKAAQLELSEKIVESATKAQEIIASNSFLEIGRLLYLIKEILEKVESQTMSMNIYDGEVRHQLSGALLLRELAANLSNLQVKLQQVTSSMNITSSG